MSYARVVKEHEHPHCPLCGSCLKLSFLRWRIRIHFWLRHRAFLRAARHTSSVLASHRRNPHG